MRKDFHSSLESVCVQIENQFKTVSPLARNASEQLTRTFKVLVLHWMHSYSIRKEFEKSYSIVVSERTIVNVVDG